MRFLADENIARSTVALLRAWGHRVSDVKEEGWVGWADAKLARMARRESHIILTLDKDFGNVLVFPPKRNPGILLVSIRDPIPSRVNTLLTTFLRGKSQRYFWRRLIVLEDTQIRIRE